MKGIGSMENPIVVSSIRSEIAFLSNLVTLEGDYILYHRLGSTHFGKRILDHYEAIDCSGNRHELYVDPYGEKIVAIPPDGFLFDRDFFYCDFADFTDGEDDDIDEEHVYKRPEGKKAKMIDRYICESYGVNNQVDFPGAVIDMMIEEGVLFVFDKSADEVKKSILECLVLD